jgi:hypothetical protein
VRQALKKERDEEAAEEREMRQILGLEERLRVAEQRNQALMELRSEWRRLAGMADGAADTADRRMARRVVRGLSMSAGERVKDEEYLKVVAAYRMGR